MEKDQTDIRRIYWKKEEEELLRTWADKAQCYQWLHMRSRDVYQKKNALYTIPVIIISTIVGTANFAQDRFSEGERQYVTMAIGSLSIIAGVISTVSQFLKVSELNEAHRIASLSWGKFFRSVKTELTRHPLDREPPSNVINFNKEEFDRLVEISPPVPKKVLEEFKKKFKGVDKLTRPEICDQLSPTKVFEITEDERKKIIENITNIGKKQVQKKKNEKAAEKEKEVQQKYRETFFNLNGRYPDDLEIKRYMEKIQTDEKEEDVVLEIQEDDLNSRQTVI